MKVLYIIHTNAGDGSTISFLNMVSGLESKGVEIVILGPPLKGTLLKQLRRDSFSYHVIRVAESVYPPSLITYRIGCIFKYAIRVLNLLRRRIICYYDVKRIVVSEAPDIIHTNVGTIHEGFRVAKRLRIPHVWHIREYQDLDFGWKPFPSKSRFIRMLHDSYIITITHSLESYFGPFDRDKEKTIYNGILDNLGSDTIWPRKKYFLCASRISPEKGIDEAIRGFSSFHKNNPDYRLVLLGGGNQEYIVSLVSLSKQLGCQDAVIWEGYKDNVVDYLRQATGLIVASYYEGFGRMTAEAGFAGCIVVGRNSGGTKEIIGETGGELFDSVEELAEKLVLVSRLSKDEYLKRSTFAMRRAQELYSIDSNVEGIYQFYESILNKRDV